jgi:type VI secretion system secreted protein VgrG
MLNAAKSVRQSGGANEAKFLVDIEGLDASLFAVTRFSGRESVSAPYSFEIDFQVSGRIPPPQAEKIKVTAEQALGKPCRFTLIRGSDGSRSVYSGVVKEFGAKLRAKPVYTVRLVPWLDLLSLNVSSRVFQRLSAPQIVRDVIEASGLGDYCEFRYECEGVYPDLPFCVQHRESDLDFISRLMERNGIWYYFDTSGDKDRVVVTDSFSKFPQPKIEVPYSENIGFSETSGAGRDAGESVHSLESKAALIPKRVYLRSLNYRAPESMPEGAHEVAAAGAWGEVYEYGGGFKDSKEAERLAKLYMRRLQVENMRTEGRGRCVAFRAGRLVTVSGGGRPASDFLLTSVTHEGGRGVDDVYTYSNSFACIDSAPRTYAPPLRAPLPSAAGLVTAPVEATGEGHPGLDGMGRYRVRFPYDKSDAKDYEATKDIRVAQPSDGRSDDRNYGIHFPSKRGAEMVLAYVDGDPDKPVGLGFVPNSAAPSVVHNRNRDLNVIRTWGDNVLIMDDMPQKQKIVIASSGNNHQIGRAHV